MLGGDAGETLRRGIVAAVAIVALAGCSGTIVEPDTFAARRVQPESSAGPCFPNPLPSHVVGLPPDCADPLTIAHVRAHNERVLRTLYKQERPDSAASDPRPGLCLALSGGGLRAAAFSIGVFKGLHESEVLPRIEVISAVSGGSYAMTWYYAQYLKQMRTVQEAKRSVPSNEQAPRIARETIEKAVFDDPLFHKDPLDHSALINKPLVAVKFVGLGVFKSLIDLTAKLLNRLGLRDGDPLPSLAHSDYKAAIKAAFHGGRELTWKDLEQLVASARAPTPILVAAGTLPDAPARPDSRAVFEQLFEMTPSRIGSDWFTYRPMPEDFPLSVTEATAVSGAAADEVYWSHSWVTRFFHGGLGYTWLNYSWKDANDRAQRGIYLTDGAYAENLGVYPLVKRLCRTIIAVDSGEDPTHKFDDLCRLNNGLDYRMKVGVEFEQSAITSAGFAMPEAQIAEGRIGPFPVPYAEDKEGQGMRIQFIYVKLPKRDWEPLKPDAGRCSIGELGAAACYASKCREAACQFPQDETVTLSYTRKQFDAYVQLGRGTALGLKKDRLAEPRSQAPQRVASAPLTCPKALDAGAATPRLLRR